MSAPTSLGRRTMEVLFVAVVYYVGARSWFFGQPQFRVDLGSLLYNMPGELFVGTEYQFWINKLGDPVTNESALQALVVWQF